MKAIRVLLCGGLGNQLFQYAFGRSVSLRSGLPLVLDAGTLFYHDKEYQRKYELDAFKLSQEIEVSFKHRSLVWLRLRVMRRVKSSFFSILTPIIHEDCKNKQHDKWLNFRLKRTAYLHGYWQVPDYFSNISEIIRNDLIFREEISEARKPMLDKIHSANAVAVHIRCVQYSRQVDVEYYEKAISVMRERVENARFFIFTDDPAWVHRNGLLKNDIELVSDIGLPSIEDFKLMSKFQNFIIANSSFSWWAAWMGAKNDGLVMCPPALSWSNRDSICKKWLVID